MIDAFQAVLLMFLVFVLFPAAGLVLASSHALMETAA